MFGRNNTGGGQPSEHPSLVERILVSYDVARGRASVRGKVQRKVYGDTSRKTVGGGTKTYRYEGLLSQNEALRVGQSVLLLPVAKGRRFLRFLSELDVPFKALTVFVTPGEDASLATGPRKEAGAIVQSTLK